MTDEYDGLFSQFKTYENFRVTMRGNVLELCLCNPKRMNKMSVKYFIEMYQVFKVIERSEEDIRAVVLTFEGKHFSAGLDRLLIS